MALLLGIILLSNSKIDNGNYFSIKEDTQYLLLGPSQPECAFNDSLIPGLSNFAQSGDSYFYVYYKTKKILEHNKNIKIVFIELSNNLIDSSMNYMIWSQRYLSYKYQKYGAVIKWNDLALLAKHNPASVLKVQGVTLKNNLLFLSKRKTDFIKESGWGGYLFNDRQNIDSLKKTVSKDQDALTKTALSSCNIEYLLKTVELCKNNHVTVCFIRSPVYHMAVLRNESQFQSVLKTSFPNIEFLDFKNYPLRDDQFGDFDHLNYKGANDLSHFFYDFISNGEINNAALQGRLEFKRNQSNK